MLGAVELAERGRSEQQTLPDVLRASRALVVSVKKKIPGDLETAENM